MNDTRKLKFKYGILYYILIVFFLGVICFLGYSIIVPVSRENVLFNNVDYNNNSNIGPLGSERSISIKYNSEDTDIYSIFVPLKKMGKTKKQGKIRCLIFKDGAVVETKEFLYKDIEASRYDGKINLEIDLEKPIKGIINVEFYGDGLKNRVYLLGTSNKNNNYNTYIRGEKQNKNVMCCMMGIEEIHPYSWELCVLLIVLMMWLVMERR